MKQFTVLFMLLLCLQSQAQQPAELVANMDAYLQRTAASGWSGSALVSADGLILLEKGYGMADREAATQQTAETVFSIGSITKQFTAAAIMKLESQGKLRLDDPLSKYFPKAPADKAGITLHQLLTHSAGFPGALGDDYDNLSAEEFAKLALAEPLLNPPGDVYEYSNVGYSLLGIIVEKASGKGYETFLRENLWLPAGMKRTGYVLPKFKKEELAVGYKDGSRWGTALDRPWLADGPGWHLRANGGVLSTAGDMHRWYKALKNNVVLPKTATEKMFTPHIAEGEHAQSFYGYGWTVQDFRGRRIIWHNGGNGVYNAIMSFDLVNDACIIVSSNSNDFISDEIALQLALIRNNETPQPKGQDLPAGMEESFRNNPVTNTVYQTIVENGADHFRKNSHEILKSAGFDFDNDMQLLGVGERLEEVEKWEEGAALFEVYVELFPRIVVAWNRLGVCRKALGDKEGAKVAWSQSVKLRPNGNPAAKWLLELN